MKEAALLELIAELQQLRMGLSRENQVMREHLGVPEGVPVERFLEARGSQVPPDPDTEVVADGEAEDPGRVVRATRERG